MASAVTLAAAAPAAAHPVDLGSPSPELKRLFTPAAADPDTYEVYESDQPLDRLAAALRARDRTLSAGAWVANKAGAGDAFGIDGPYNRSHLALLVRGDRVIVARGSLEGSKGEVTAYTLISPYPDASFSRLKRGTMTIVYRVRRVRP